MTEQLPLDPWGGVVGYFVAPPECPRNMAEGILMHAAGRLGIGIEILPNGTAEDKQFINAIVGLDQEPDPQTTSQPSVKMRAPIPPSVVFLSRLPAGHDGAEQLDYGLLAEKLDELYEAAGAMAQSVN